MIVRLLIVSQILVFADGGPRSLGCAQPGHPFHWLNNLLHCLYETPTFHKIDDIQPANWQIDQTKADEINYHLNDNPNVVVDDPSKLKSVVDRMERDGYSPQVHTVTTEDGYLLTYYRIAHGKTESGSTKHRPPVLIQHGIFAYSSCWLTQKETNNLPYILAEEGYDVWLGNARGTTVSQSHLTLSADDDAFWDFSWEEMGYYDLPAAIDYILDKNGDQSLYYIGHSMGTTMFFVCMSLRPEYNHKIRLMTAYAPIAFVFHTTSPVRMLGPLGYLPLVSNSSHCVLPSDAVAALEPYLNRFCDPIMMSSKLCSNFLFLLMGFDYLQTNLTQLDDFVTELGSPTSLKAVQHFTQGVIWDDFRRFNRGKVANCESYGTCNPPSYNLSAVTSPVALIFGPNDMLANIQDISRLSSALPNVVLNYRVPFDEWNHIDFLTAIQVRKLVYEPTIHLMKRF